MAFRIAFIGAGSVGFTRTLVKDLLQVPEFRTQPMEVALHDIDEGNLDRIYQILKKEIDANGFPTRITATADRREALDGARYVVNCTRIGGLEAFATDIDIPLKYGIDQCVGDTLCAGGIMYGQRNIAQVLAFQKDMAELCDHDAPAGPLFLNYANPMAMNTWAALDAYDRGEGIDTVGLCHGVEGGWRQIASALTHLHGEEDLLKQANEEHPGYGHRDLVDIVCAGINHQTWYIEVRYKGRVVESDELLEAFETHPNLPENEPVRIDVLRRFGVYSTESNGHLSEYLPWYRKRREEISQWVGPKSWINGETGGYLRVCTEGRNWFKTDFPEWLDKAGTSYEEWHRSSEHGSYIIEAMETGRIYRGHFNRRNGNTIANLPEDCIIEAPGFVDRFGINMVEGLELPMAAAATCQASVDVQRMSKEAAVNADVALLKQAMLHDPLTGAICNPEEVWQMADEMLVEQRQWLPQFEAIGACDEAAERLSAHEKAGTRVERTDWQGAARQKIKSVEELRAEKDASVLEADKAAASRAKEEKLAKA
ncbi:MAG: alpha-galactosidase [Phycisphaeraceae bacterium]